MRRLAFALPVLALLVAGALIATALLLRDSSGGGSAIVKDLATTPAENARPRAAARLDPQSSVCQGLLHVPDPGAPRVFPAIYTKHVSAAGLTIVGDAQVDDAALEIARKTVETMFRDNVLAGTLASDGAYVIVADSSQGVLDLPEFGCLSNAANDAFYSHVCGVADRADYPVATVNELDLMGDESGPCAGLNILYHEVGHLVQGWAVAPADYFDIRQIYQDALNAGKYRRDYAATNANEYFAEATQAYFFHADTEGRRDRAWLADYDPAIFELLDRVYRGR